MGRRRGKDGEEEREGWGGGEGRMGRRRGKDGEEEREGWGGGEGRMGRRRGKDGEEEREGWGGGEGRMGRRGEDGEDDNKKEGAQLTTLPQTYIVFTNDCYSYVLRQDLKS